MSRETGDTGVHAETTLQKEAMATQVTPVSVAALQAALRTGCAFVFHMICKVSVPTFLDALGLEEEKWLFTACAPMGALALETVAVAPLTEAQVLVVPW